MVTRAVDAPFTIDGSTVRSIGAWAPATETQQARAISSRKRMV